MPVNILKSHPDVQPAEFDVSYVGRVLALREENGYDDSDFVALCWDDEKEKVVRVVYATTRCWTYRNSAVVDAPDELRRAIADRVVARVVADVPNVVAGVRGTVCKGAGVRVVAGRKYVGREGKVFWCGEKADRYSRRTEVRCGVEDTDGDRFFLPASQVEVTVPAVSGDRLHREVVNTLYENLSTALWNSACGLSAREVWDEVKPAVVGTVVAV